MIADVAARAVQRTIEESELHTGRDGYFLVREALAAFADRLLELGVDRGYVAELYAAIAEISRLEHRRPDGPDLPPTSADPATGSAT